MIKRTQLSPRASFNILQHTRSILRTFFSKNIEKYFGFLSQNSPPHCNFCTKKSLNYSPDRVPVSWDRVRTRSGTGSEWVGTGSGPGPGPGPSELGPGPGELGPGPGLGSTEIYQTFKVRTTITFALWYFQLRLSTCPVYMKINHNENRPKPDLNSIRTRSQPGSDRVRTRSQPSPDRVRTRSQLSPDPVRDPVPKVMQCFLSTCAQKLK